MHIPKRYIPGISLVYTMYISKWIGYWIWIHAVQPAIKSACLSKSATAHRPSSAHRFICSWQPAPLILCWCRQRLAKVGRARVPWPVRLHWRLARGGIARPRRGRHDIIKGWWNRWRLNAVTVWRRLLSAGAHNRPQNLVVGRQQHLQFLAENGFEITCRMFCAEDMFDGYLKTPS